MRNITRLFMAVAFMFTAFSMAQSTITGTVKDAEMNAPLPGANIVEKGTSNGVSSDFDGNFTLTTEAASGEVVISYVGYGKVTLSFNGNANLGEIALTPDNSLEEIVIIGTGIVDIAKDRETPVAVSTIRAEEITEKLGSQEFPEILKSTPSVYATKQGGGFGDSRINIRGFDQRNTAVMVNGMPVNDMENGWVYWSNWAGLSDVTSAIQVQRGLGSSKLAISSVGGTINVITKSSDKKEGGSIGFITGNNNYLKTLASYNTGKMENGLSFSALMGRSAGDGYVDGTPFEGYNYFLAFGYQPNDKHDFQLTVTGAPQQHYQRSFAPTLGDYIRYGDGEEPRIKYNSDWGYRNGEVFTFGGNFYHKPIASLNWDWDISDKSSLSTVLYASFGRGGSIGSIGRIDGGRSYYGQFKNSRGIIRVDDIVAYNQGANIPAFGDPRTGYTGGGNPMYQGMFVNGGDNSYGYESDGGHIFGTENGISQRSSINSHNWFGAVINFNNEINENWTWDVGVDLRSYKGFHYRRLVDLLGADVYVDNDNINNTYNFTTETYAPSIQNTLNVFKSIDDEEKIDYYNLGYVRWYGAFGQLEYKNDKISAFVQGGISNQDFKREDPFNYLDSDPEQETDWVSQTGGNIKAGLNYNINEKHNVFANAGYYIKQPLFDAVFLNFVNEINDDLTNEKILGVEVGYGFRSQYLNANVNLYRTSWKDRFLSSGYTRYDNSGAPIFEGSVNYEGVEQVHMGVEVDFVAKPTSFLNVNGMLSVGNWEYAGNPTGTVFDGNDAVGEASLVLDGVKVGDAAQFTTRLGFDIEPVERLVFDANWFHADDLYAQFGPEDFVDENADGAADSDFLLQLPSYDLFDAGLSYKMLVGKDKKQSVNLRLNVNNVFDEVYISEADSNRAPDDDPANNWNGVNKRNNVFFGFGRTWNFGIRYNF
ncbi:MAG: TonB-dependent receptor [Algicola sp.]|nr:TonB-dependent receptor [Algicola sp.]